MKASAVSHPLSSTAALPGPERLALVDSDPPQRSIVRALYQQVAKQPAAVALLGKCDGCWRDTSWLEWWDRSVCVAAALLHLGIEPGQHVAIVANSRVEWAVADMGIMMTGAATVPVYAASTTEQVAFILRDSAAAVAFFEDGSLLSAIGARVPELPHLRLLASIDPAPAARAWGPTHEGLFVQQTLRDDPFFVPSWQQFLALGNATLETRKAELEARIASLKHDTLACLIYTSGTTGLPKGVRISHGNLLHNVDELVSLLEPTGEDSQFLFLPFAHIMGKLNLLGSMVAGLPTAVDPDLARVLQHCQELHPTYFVSVPRLLEKLYLRLRDTPSLLAKTLGGRVRCVWSGGAALPRHVLEFFHEARVPVYDGYGMTEAGVVTVNGPGRTKLGSVGRPLADTQMRVAADGELLVRSPAVMLGYHERPEEDAAAFEVIDGDRYLRTGDIGHIDSEGYLWITDRKKDIFKTSGGKQIAPQVHECLLRAQSPLISRAVICGANRPYVTALLTLDEEALRAWAIEQGRTGTYADLTRDPAVRQSLQCAIDSVNAGLARFETIKRFAVLDRDFSRESAELTPSTKLRRAAILQKHEALVEALYASDDEPHRD